MGTAVRPDQGGSIHSSISITSAGCYRTSRPPNREELLGALAVQVALLRRELLDDWSDEA
ncbi:hypothetical protein [Cryptosporangium arvum]|uniref:hypothetical protein n=1 Tax=Cryptosporangium arvum TaxID=80871 RepID=UPI0004BB6556|nr:hypothetical protein [Cryptosporangium arvum]